MRPEIILTVLLCYFGLLVAISWFTSRNAGENAYFLGNKSSPWYAVALGMIGDSLSGVTFISVPGNVAHSHFFYLQLVLGYFFGYMIIAQVLLPLYYKMNVTSIYSYLGKRFGEFSEKTGAFYFIISRLAGAGGRLFLSAGIIHLFVIEPMFAEWKMNVPFFVTVSVIILLMLVYTLKGGIKTLVWTDVLQSSFLLLGVVLSIAALCSGMDMGIGEMISSVSSDPKSEVFSWDWQPKSFFPKQFIGGMLIAIAMTGLDQNMMQKNLSCKSLGDAQKNIRWFSVILIFVNIFFLSLGVLLYQYAQSKGVDLPMKGEKINTDAVFPTLALNEFGLFAAMAFIIGLTASTFSSADSVLTTLTTSFYFDMLKADKKNISEKQRKNYRTIIHIIFSFLLLLTILLFQALNDDAMINTILNIANYTYGPLLGLFALGIFTKRKINDNWVPFICILSPVICYILNIFSKEWLGGYEFGFELLGINAAIVFGLLYALGKRSGEPDSMMHH